jgi:hypothetical protein
VRHTPETKAKLSEMRRGERNPFYGRRHTPEARAKISAATRHRNLTGQRAYEPSPQRIVLPGEDTLAYVAGLVDADGSIRFSGGRPFIAIYNTNASLIAWLVETFGYGCLSNGNMGREQVRAWRLSAARDVYALVGALRPRLIVKAEDADIALAWLRDKYGWEEVVANG